MRREEPGWWFGDNARSPAPLLQPAASLYGWIAERRFRKSEPYRARLPVICVGNLTVGGAGKTPLAIHVARLLVGIGQRPVVLSRGYGGSIAGPHMVDPELDKAAEVGDEPLLLARHGPVCVARDRAAGARSIEADAGLGATVIVMDDGLQNPSLAKTLTLAVVDGGRGIGNGRVLPAGPLRAPLDFQLGLVDALVIADTRGARQARAALEPLLARYKGPVIRTSTEPASGPGRFADKPYVAFAGIGHPAKLFATAAEAGLRLAARESFPDHHPYSLKDAERLLALAARHHAGLVTTEKDWVRLPEGDNALGRLKAVCETLPIRLALEPSEASRLSALIELAVRAGETARQRA